MARDFSIPVFIFSDGEEKARKELKKIWHEVFSEEVDLDHCDKITVLQDSDFEGYLLKNGFTFLIEQAIADAEGENTEFIKSWIGHHGISKKRHKTDEPPCINCGQDIYRDEIIDYTSENGRERAIHDILDRRKTKYAPFIAQKLCELEREDLPPKLTEFFEKIKKVLSDD
jgi:putative ATP-dependent endonuclease of OLD family